MGLNSPIPARPSAAHLRLLKRLSEAVGIPGSESEVRKIIRAHIEPFADELRTDAMGNLLVIRKGPGRRRLRVMLAAHMDEVGFMVISVGSEGELKFETVGGLDPRQLLGKPVWVGKDRLPGVIGGKPVHLATREELKQTVKVESMAIDIGVSKKETAEGKVEAGAGATFATPFRRIRGMVRGKALDDRMGVAILAELLEHPPEGIELQAAFTVQEEVGLRGARIAAHALNPEVAIVLDCTPARDLPAWDGEENTQYNAKLGLGPAIYVADARTLAHPGMLRHLVHTAESSGIPYQIRQPGGGGTDAGAIHLTREGIPSISVSVPARYIHTACSIATVSDWRNTVRLVHAAVSGLSVSVLGR
ncbi:MAG: M42 family metallopeptidase [Anaerolineae bacterium]|nr:MAG: M42 family metallopeptidase [Anaerolineae bacterium]